MNEIHFDALLPQEMAAKAEQTGVCKAEMPFLKTFMLAVLAGAFISLGAIFATTVSAGGIAIAAPSGNLAFNAGLPYGVSRLLAGLVFCLGLILVVLRALAMIARALVRNPPSPRNTKTTTASRSCGWPDEGLRTTPRTVSRSPSRS